MVTHGESRVGCGNRIEEEEEEFIQNRRWGNGRSGCVGWKWAGGGGEWVSLVEVTFLRATVNALSRTFPRERQRQRERC